MTLPRGPCPPALAAEVYALTLARVRKRYRETSPHQQTIPDAVGAAYADWLASPRDKEPIPAGLHVHFLIQVVFKFLHGRRRGGGVKPCVGAALGSPTRGHEEAFEDHLRDWRAESPALLAEDDAIERIDAARRIGLGRRCEDAPEAVRVLLDRAWSLLQIAEAAGASEQAVQTWVRGRMPQPRWRAPLLRLAATDGPPPPAVTGPELHAARCAVLPLAAPPSAVEVRDALASLLRTHTHRSLAALVDVTPQAVTSWAGGKRHPRPAPAAALVRLALTMPDAPAIMAA